jgi:hypothetical protein
MPVYRLAPSATLAVALLLHAASPAQGEPRSSSHAAYDRVVAVINRQVVTLSELQFEARLALLQAGGPEALLTPLDGPLLRSTLEYVIGQRLQVAEAEKLQAFVVEPQEVDAAVQALQRRAGGEPALRDILSRSDMEPDALAAVVARRIRAERALDGKLRLKAQVSDAEVRRAWETRPDVRARPFEDVRAELRDRLIRERYRELAAAELQRLRRAADVRVVDGEAWQGTP